MRNIDLDQFWPQIASQPLQRTGAGDRSSVAVPPPLHDEAGTLAAPARASRDVIEAPSDSVSAAGTEDVFPRATPPAGLTDAARLRQALERAAEASPHTRPQPRPPLSDAPRGPAAGNAMAPGAAADAARPVMQTPAKELPETGGADAALLLDFEEQRPRFDRTPLVWGGLGFLAGVLAWHALGFWAFVSDVVLNSNDGKLETASPMPHLAKAAEHSFGKLTGKPVTAAVSPAKTSSGAGKGAASGAALCIEVAMDRTGGGIARKDCAASAQDGMRDAGYNRRSDRLALRPRLQDPVAWSGSTAVEAEASTTQAEPERSDSAPGDSAAVMDFGTLKPSDLKLDIDTRN